MLTNVNVCHPHVLFVPVRHPFEASLFASVVKGGPIFIITATSLEPLVRSVRRHTLDSKAAMQVEQPSQISHGFISVSSLMKHATEAHHLTTAKFEILVITET